MNSLCAGRAGSHSGGHPAKHGRSTHAERGFLFCVSKCGFMRNSSDVIHASVSVTSKSVWQKPPSSDQCLDMADYVLPDSPRASGVVCTRTLALWGKLKNSKNSRLFCGGFVFLLRMFGIFKNIADKMEWVVKSRGVCLCQRRWDTGTGVLHSDPGAGLWVPPTWSQLGT